MSEKPIHVLFLCTGNSARSILCEAMLNHFGDARFKGFSAGSQPKNAVHPMTLKTLEKFGASTQQYRSKSWDEFSGNFAPVMDIVVTVCSNAAAEVCPVWPASTVVAHWHMADPAAYVGSIAAQEKQFERTRRVAHSAVSELVQTVLNDSDPKTPVPFL